MTGCHAGADRRAARPRRRTSRRPRAGWWPRLARTYVRTEAGRTEAFQRAPVGDCRGGAQGGHRGGRRARGRPLAAGGTRGERDARGHRRAARSGARRRGAAGQVIHDGISQAVYAGVRVGLRAAARGRRPHGRAARGDDGAPLAATPRGSLALGALNGMRGDQLAARGSALALPMTIRLAHPRRTRPGRGSPSSSTGCARPTTRGGCRRADLRRRLRDELGYTPVYLRYNTGLHISDNGRAAGAAARRARREWPVAVEEVVLVGHSMGGLVARSACHYGEARRGALDRGGPARLLPRHAAPRRRPREGRERG